MGLDNPLKDPASDPFKSWLEELSDLEVIGLLERVSDDMKRRNQLLKSARGAPAGQSVKEALDAFLYGPGKSG